MLIFSKRNALAKECEKWLKENGCAKEPVNVVTWLEIKGLLDESACEKLIKEIKEANNGKRS